MAATAAAAAAAAVVVINIWLIPNLLHGD